MVRYAILGPIELCNGARRVGVGGPRQVALLALLLVNANRALSTDELIEALWHDRASAGLVKRLRMAVARLRRTLDPEGARGEPVLRTIAGGYLLAVRPGELDSDVFQTRVEQGRRALQAGEAAHGRAVLHDAIQMWRGPALAEVAYGEFAQPEIRRLEELRLAALEARMECDLQLGQHGELIGELEAIIVAHPGRERLAAQLMLALYRCGRQSEALDVYARTRAYLMTEFGLEPGPALQALQVEILAQSPALQLVADEPHSGPGGAERRVMLTLPRTLRAPAGSPFVGREIELARLREHWMQVGAGMPSATIIGGEAGIGKTRLAAELAHQVHRGGGLVLYGRCGEGLAVPYQPFVEALRPYVHAVGRDRLRADLGDLAPELSRLLPELTGLGEPVRCDPESERFALFEAVAALIEAATREQRALLVLDDLHWATRPTLLLVRHLLRCERPLGMLLLCIYRETELDFGQPLAQLLADVQGDQGVQLMSLRGLEMAAIATLLEGRVGHALDERASPLVRELAAQTAGNPFFLRALLADVAGSHAGFPGGEHVSLEAMAARLDVPEGLRYVIGQRVARLSAPARRALCAAAVAAVAGATFSLRLLERVLGEESGVLDVLDEVVAAGLLAEAGHGDYVFAHALVRQTIYGQLSAARRMRLHRQLGEALEALDTANAHVEALAYHFAQAAPDGQGPKAADYALSAGRYATARLGYEEAAAHYQRGLQGLTLSGQAHDEQRCELLLALGEARWGTGDLDKARHAFRQAAQVAERIGDKAALARAALGYCGPHRIELMTAVSRPVTELLQRALGAFDDGEDSALRARLMGRLAAELADPDLKRQRITLAYDADGMARRVADRAALGDVLASAYRATRGPNAVHESVGIAMELRHVADEIGDVQLQARAHQWLLDHLLELADIDAVERELDALQRLVGTRRERIFKWDLGVIRANHAYLLGQLEECEILAQHALADRFQGDDKVATLAFTGQIMFVRREQGRLDEIVEAIEGIASERPDVIQWRVALAYIYAELERTVQARREIEVLARGDFTDIPRAYWLFVLSLVCEIIVFLDDLPWAQLLYNLLWPYADRCTVAFSLLCYGSASRPLGLLATTLSRYDDATDHFERALKTNAQIRSPLWIAHTQHDYARMLLQRDRPGDRYKALKLLNEALATADQLGLKALAGKVRSLPLGRGWSRAPSAQAE